MLALNADFAPARLALKNLPARRRVEHWHDVIGRQILRLDSEPLDDSDIAFDADMVLRALPGIKIATGTVGGSRDRRTPELTHDGNDDVALLINHSGPLCIRQRSLDAIAARGEGFVLNCAEPADFRRPQPGGLTVLYMSRAGLAPLVENLDDMHGRLSHRGEAAMRLLVSYLDVLGASREALPPPLCQSISSHLFELAAMAIAGEDASVGADHVPGLAAAQLSALKADIVRNVAAPYLNVADVASRHRLSTRAVQRLFEHDGQTFSEFLLRERLARAHRILSNRGAEALKIGEVAFACGFGDLSYFNRSFRRRYGIAPSELRALKRPS